MKRWIGAGLLAATLMVTGCADNGYYRRGYRYDRDYHYRNYRGHYDRHHDHDRDNWR